MKITAKGLRRILDECPNDDTPIELVFRNQWDEVVYHAVCNDAYNVAGENRLIVEACIIQESIPHYRIA